MPVGLLGLGVGQLVQRCLSILPRKSIGWQSVPSRGKKQGESPEQMVSAAVRNIPSNPSWGQWAASSGSSQPFLRVFTAVALPNPGAGYPDSLTWAPKWVSKNLKHQWKDKVGGKESLLYFKVRQSRWEGRLLSEGPLPAISQWPRVFIGWGSKLHAETAQSALTVILKLVISQLTSVILTVLCTVNL